VATAVPGFVSFEVGAIDALGRFGFLATLWHRAFITVLRMEAVVYVALKLVSAMKPRASANEAVAIEPFRAIVAGGSAVIRGGIVVTIRTLWSYSNLNADLGIRLGSGRYEADGGDAS
jgi:hypothetical protein